MSEEKLSKDLSDTMQKLNQLLVKAANMGLEVDYQIDNKTFKDSLKIPVFIIRLMKEV